MNKKFLNVLLFCALTAGSTGTFVSCSDYDDDIDNLQQQIDKINVSLGELQTMIENGSVIKSVETTAEGILITLSNNATYTLTNGKDGKDGADGKDGVDGTNGKDAVAWTIGPDGYWYQDDVKTNYKAIGTDGKDGADGVDGTDGTNGTNGKDGQNGEYYVPNEETGNFDIYRDGEKIKETNISWKASGVSAVYTGNALTLSGVEAEDGSKTNVTIYVGKQLGSVAFVPEVMSSVISYPTTTDEFFHLTTYLDEAKYDATTKAFISQTSWEKSNVVDMLYRLNPTDAYVENALLGFINRSVTTRAAGDNGTLLNVHGNEFKADGSVLVNATINASALAASPKQNIAALQVWSGQNPVTSDYVYVTSEGIDVLLVDSLKTEEGTLTEFYKRTKSILGAEENDAFVKSFVALTASANLSFGYTGNIDLKKYVGLYSDDKDEFLADLGFVGMTYEFSKPKEYKANDQQQTNQQDFIELNDGVVKVASGWSTAAIGRTPVIRVDAFLTSNSGTRQLVASSYIKLSITLVEGADKDAIKASIDEDVLADYHKLLASGIANADATAEMGWEDVNRVLYENTQLTSTSFWNNYNNEYLITVTTTDKTTGNEVKLITEKATASDQLYTHSESGLDFEIMLNKNDIQTSYIMIRANNKAKSQNTYKDINGKGAEYKITIAIQSNDTKMYPDIILSQNIYVKEVCAQYQFNTLYYLNSFNGQSGDFVQVKGQVESNKWVMSAYIGEQFAIVEGKDIFDYCKTGNVTDITFAVDPADADFAEITTANVIKTKKAIDEPSKVVKVNYETALENGEKCTYSYNVIFLNPLTAKDTTGTKLYGNGQGEKSVSVKPFVSIYDRWEQDAIYTWSEADKDLVLSTLATSEYYLTAPTVEYDFKKDTNYTNLIGNLHSGSTLKVDADGNVVWENLGDVLVSDHHLTVIATVTFAGISVVECEIPVTLTKDKNE